MHRRGIAAVGMACAVALVGSACGSDDEESGGGGGSSAADSGPIRLGLLTSLSGPAAVAYGESVGQGIDARLAVYAEEDGECADRVSDLEVVEVDDASSPQGALAGMQRLVQQEDVFAIEAVTALFAGASAFATTQGADIPVLGSAQDGAAEWNQIPDNNLFASFPVPNYDRAFTTYGDYATEVGGTVVAGVAFNQPSSQAGLEQLLVSTDEAGLERGYVNDNVPFGSTDVGPIVLGIIDSQADVVVLAITADTGFAIYAGLQQAGYTPKAVVLLTGYGPELLASEPAVQIGQGAVFTSPVTPVEIETEASARLRQAMIDHTDSPTGQPGYGQLQGWMNTDLFLYGLEQAGCDATQAEFMEALRDDQSWNAGGLYPNPVKQDSDEYDEQCGYFLRLEGDGFVPESDEPICGSLIE